MSAQPEDDDHLQVGLDLTRDATSLVVLCRGGRCWLPDSAGPADTADLVALYYAATAPAPRQPQTVAAERLLAEVVADWMQNAGPFRLDEWQVRVLSAEYAQQIAGGKLSWSSNPGDPLASRHRRRGDDAPGERAPGP